MSKFTLSLLSLTLLAGATWAQSPDSDGDGVPDDLDTCPTISAAGFDVDGDGCVDATANTRHIEYWADGDLPFSYVIHDLGADVITDGSDLQAVRDGFAEWTSLADSRLAATYGGTTQEGTTDGMDGIHHVSFVDENFVAVHGTAVLAVGLTTSFEQAANFLGRDVRPGQIVDADMLFNPNRNFSTDTAGVGIDLRSVATHEAGHLFGISHSAVEAATMFPALQPGAGSRDFSEDDVLMAFMADPVAAALAGATILEGTVLKGDDQSPARGAVVYVRAAGSQSWLANSYTFPDGSYRFVGLTPGSYELYVHPLDGSTAVAGVTPRLVNALVEDNVDALFVPEFWDLNESADDDGTVADAIDLVAGSTFTADIITNVDTSPPGTIDIQPIDGTTNVRTDGVIIVQFDEAIDLDTLAQNLRVEALDTAGAPVQQLFGPLTLISDENLVVFNPNGTLDYATSFRVTVGPGIEDVFGNASSTQSVVEFSTESEPALAVASLAPGKGVPGTTAVLSGSGFDESPANNIVRFGSTAAQIVSATTHQLVVSVPFSDLGDLLVTVEVAGQTSDPVLFTMLTNQEVVRGNPFDEVALSGVPHAMATLPDGNFGYIATSSGVSVISLNGSTSDYAQEIAQISLPEGADDLAVTPDGRRVYAVSRDESAIHVIDSNYGELENRSSLFNQLLATLPMSAQPLAIAIDAAGRRAYIPTGAGTVEIWDVLREIRPGETAQSVTFHRQIGEFDTGQTDLIGAVAVSPDGTQLLLARGNGRVLSYASATPHTQLANVVAGTQPTDLTIDPLGQRAYVSDGAGFATLVTLSSYSVLPAIDTGGSLKGIAVSPAGKIGFAIDSDNDLVNLLDLDSNNLTFRSVAGDVDVSGYPIDATLSPDGNVAYVLEQNSPRVRFVGIGYGPILEKVYPQALVPGTIAVLEGEGFGLKFPGTASLDNPVVLIGGEQVPATRSDDRFLYFTVPVSFQGGLVQAQNLGGPAVLGVPTAPVSNALFVPLAADFLDDPPPLSTLRVQDFDSNFGYDWPTTLNSRVEWIPYQDLVVFNDDSADVLYMMDVRRGSPTYETVISTPSYPGFMRDMAPHPDGTRLYVSHYDGIAVIDTDRNSPTFGDQIASVSTSNLTLNGIPIAIEQIAVSPGGETLLFNNGADGFERLVWVQLRDDSPAQYDVFGWNLSLTSLPLPYDVVVHPSGSPVYAAASDGGSGVVFVSDNDPSSPDYTLLLGTVNVVNTINSMACSPDGTRLYVGTRDIAGVDDFRIFVFSLFEPEFPELIGVQIIDTGTPTEFGHIEAMPRSDRILVNTGYDMIYLDAFSTGFVQEIPSTRIGVDSFGSLYPDLALSPDGTQVYLSTRTNLTSIGPWTPGKVVIDRGESQQIVVLSGDNQIGVAGQELPAPIRVRLVWGDFQPRPNSSLFVRVKEGTGVLGNGQSEQYFVTDSNGEFVVRWTLGPELTPNPAPAPGNEVQQLEIVNEVLDTITVGATVLPDPGSVPLRIAQVLPLNQSTGIGVSTSVALSFSRPVDPATIGSSTFALQKQGDTAQVPSVYGFANGNKTVSILSLTDLEFATNYSITATAGILDTDGNALENPQISNFQTKLPPQLGLSSISPPSAVVGGRITINGSGFSSVKTLNVVQFAGGVSATPLSASNSRLEVVVPANAITGGLSVQTNGNTSNARNFTVLVPTDQPLDEILASVETGITTQNMVVLSSGEKAYSISADTDQVLPVDLVNYSAQNPILVGNRPVAIVKTPDDSRLYVANFESGTVSVINTANDMIIDTIPVGPKPVDMVITNDGTSVYVITAGDQILHQLDCDPDSGTYNTVKATAGVGTSTKGAAVTPDGTKLYLGTSTGFLIIELAAGEFGVKANVGTGTSTKGVAMTPDGTLLLLETENDEVLIVDITPEGNNAVKASVQTGGSTKGAALSPDGTLLYLLLEGTDDIVVVSIEVTGGVSKAADGLIGGLTVTTTQVDRFSAGTTPTFVAFDPNGSGLAIVGNAGATKGFTFLNSSNLPFGLVEGSVRVTPRTLNLQSKGRYITAKLELPPQFPVQNVDLTTVYLNDAITPVLSKTSIEDENQDGIDEYIIKFDRTEFQAIMPQGENVPVWITGELLPDNRPFRAEDAIRTIRPTVHFPMGGETFIPGSNLLIQWTSPQGVNVESVDVEWSSDNGESWNDIAMGIPDYGTQVWTVPDVPTSQGLIAVTLFDNQGDDIGMSMTNEVFGINLSPVGVALGQVEASIESGDGVLRWNAEYVAGFEGFHVLRSVREDGPFARVTEDAIFAADDGYVFRDADLNANEAYWYKLEEAATGIQHGPFKLSYVLSFALNPAVPNPFNPRTTISFSVAEQGRVRLSIYDVRGRRVRTLVDEVLRPDVYSFVWDGRDDRSGEVSSGTYLYRLEAEGFEATKKMLLLR